MTAPEDPRVEAVARRRLFDEHGSGMDGDRNWPTYELDATYLVAAADSKDPLRAMLRPEVEDQMVEVIARTITDLEFGDGAWDRIHEGWKGPPRRQARALLTVMRGLAGGGD